MFLEGYLKGDSLDKIIERWPRLGKKREMLEIIMKTRLSEASLASLSSYLIIAETIMEKIEKLDARIESLLAEFSDEVRLLLTVPGLVLRVPLSSWLR